MNKFKIVYIYISVFVISLFATNIFIEKTDRHFSEVATKATTREYISAESKYKISVFNGKVAVFEKDSKIPYKVYDTYVNTLPEKDQSILQKGIYVNTASEMMKIIEEYTS